MPLINLNEGSASRIGGAASVGAIRRRSNLARYKLLTHARRHGMDRLRETCAIVTAVVDAKGLNTEPSAELLLKTSEAGFRIRIDQVRGLIDSKRFSRAADGYQAYRRRNRPDCDCGEHDRD